MYPCAFFAVKHYWHQLYFFYTSTPLAFVEVIVSPFIVILLSTSKLSTFVAPPSDKNDHFAYSNFGTCQTS